MVAERGPRKGKLRGYGSFARNLHTYATRIYKSAVGRKGQLTDKTSIGVILSFKKQWLADAWYGLSFSMRAPSWDTATPVTPWNRLTGECLVFDYSPCQGRVLFRSSKLYCIVSVQGTETYESWTMIFGDYYYCYYYCYYYYCCYHCYHYYYYFSSYYYILIVTVAITIIGMSPLVQGLRRFR